MGSVQAGQQRGLDLSDSDLRRAITGILEFRDDPGTTANDQGAHGSAFDRVGSFQDGLQGGAAKCDSYAEAPPVVLELPFNDSRELQNGGDLSLAQVVATVPADLDRFWHEELQGAKARLPALTSTVRSYPAGGPYPACKGLSRADFEAGVVYCPSPEFVAYVDGGENAHLHDTIGDFSVGVLFAERWAEALQHHEGASTVGEHAELQRDCLTGAWVADVVPRRTGEQPFTISPGDLDEAVRTYLTLTQGDAGSAHAALSRIAAFRGGLFSGVESCGLPG
jgi:predicted metalloprotease